MASPPGEPIRLGLEQRVWLDEAPDIASVGSPATESRFPSSIKCPAWTRLRSRPLVLAAVPGPMLWRIFTVCRPSVREKMKTS